ncbi:MAG: hypothetical protein J1D99_02185 [Campylobacter sp.]|nr:hypothetical protein [Campylobacter sp.]
MSVTLNTNQTNSGVYTSNNSTSTKENDENSLKFNEILEQEKQNQVQNSKTENGIFLDLSNLSSNRARENFQKITKAVENMVDYNTGEKVDFNSLSEAQQRVLLDFVTDELYMMQNYFQSDFEIANIQIQKDENFSVLVDFTDDKGELISKKNTSSPTYTQMNEIKNLSLKQEDAMLKQALNLNQSIRINLNF